MRLLCTMLLALTVAPFCKSQTPATDIGKSGNDFLAVCKDIEEGSLVDMARTYRKGVCAAWVMGFMAGVYTAYDELHTPERERGICVPDGAPPIQAVRIIKKYIEENPEHADMKTRALAFVALINAFPCGKPNQ